MPKTEKPVAIATVRVLDSMKKMSKTTRQETFEELCNVYCITCGDDLDDEGLCPEGCDDEEDDDDDDGEDEADGLETEDDEDEEEGAEG
jgi:hypothetical protein